MSETRWLCPNCERQWCAGFGGLVLHLRTCRGVIVALNALLAETGVQAVTHEPKGPPAT